MIKYINTNEIITWRRFSGSNKLNLFILSDTPLYTTQSNQAHFSGMYPGLHWPKTPALC